MALYTRKGDKGDTGAFGCKQRFSKNSALTEALGSLDEINSLLGICKIKARDLRFMIYDLSLFEIIEQVQQNLFIVHHIKHVKPRFFLSNNISHHRIFNEATNF